MPKEEHLESTTKKINELDKRSTKGDIEELIIPESNWKVARKCVNLVLLHYLLFYSKLYLQCAFYK